MGPKFVQIPGLRPDFVSFLGGEKNTLSEGLWRWRARARREAPSFAHGGVSGSRGRQPATDVRSRIQVGAEQGPIVRCMHAGRDNSRPQDPLGPAWRAGVPPPPRENACVFCARAGGGGHQAGNNPGGGSTEEASARRVASARSPRMTPQRRQPSAGGSAPCDTGKHRRGVARCAQEPLPSGRPGCCAQAPCASCRPVESSGGPWTARGAQVMHGIVPRGGDAPPHVAGCGVSVGRVNSETPCSALGAGGRGTFQGGREAACPRRRGEPPHRRCRGVVHEFSQPIQGPEAPGHGPTERPCAASLTAPYAAQGPCQMCDAMARVQSGAALDGQAACDHLCARSRHAGPDRDARVWARWTVPGCPIWVGTRGGWMKVRLADSDGVRPTVSREHGHVRDRQTDSSTSLSID